MIKRIIISLPAVALMALLISGCGGVRSTGLLNAPEARGLIPLEIPAKVTITPVTGDVKMAGLVHDLVEDQLYLYGFDVVDYDRVDETLCSHKILPCDLMKRENRALLTDELGLDGLVVVEVSTRTQVNRIIADVKLELIRIDSGQVVWMGSVQKQKWSVKSSKQRQNVIGSVEKLLRRLKQDIKKFERAKMKRMKREQMDGSK